MSRRELRRVEAMSRVQAGELKLVDAAEMMEVSYRQGKRWWRRYREQGPEGLKHGNAGRPSNRAKPQAFREKVLRLVRNKYGGEPGERFGPTLAAEHLEQDDRLPVDAETLRRWMLGAGLWSRGRKRKQHRRRRDRRQPFGELVQLDGSFHEWLERRGEKLCLMNLVDDATSKRRPGRRRRCCGRGWKTTESRTACTLTGRTCICGSPPRSNGWREKKR